MNENEKSNPVKNPDDDYQRQQELRQIEELRQEWNAPKRHRETKPEFTGVWGEAFAKIRSLMGHGTLVAVIGTRGNGKTQLGVEAMRLATYCRRRAYYITAMRFFMRIKATYKNDTTLTEDDVLNELTRPTLLVIDECSCRSDKEWENRLLFDLINARYAAKKDTILIANQTREQFEQSLDDSIIRRLNDTGCVIVADWPPITRDDGPINPEDGKATS